MSTFVIAGGEREQKTTERDCIRRTRRDQADLQGGNTKLGAEFNQRCVADEGKKLPQHVILVPPFP